VASAAGITKLIVYRHFDSKEALYEAVLKQVSDRLAEEFVAALERRRSGGVGVTAMLTVAREDPDGFVLLWRHAATEPQFAAHAEGFRAAVVGVARTLLDAREVGDDVRRRWGAQLLVSWLVDAVIHWLEEGDPARDDELIELVAASLPAMVGAWAGVPLAPPPDVSGPSA
jgi:AcrR family transcriptional regulator